MPGIVMIDQPPGQGVRICAACKGELQRAEVNADYPPDGPLREATPYRRMTGLAAHAGLDVFELPADNAQGLAGAVQVVVDRAGKTRATVGLAQDLDEGLRTDVLAFAVALFADQADRIQKTPNSAIGIRREPQPPDATGPGHVAWHMAEACGRETTSATFTVVEL
ncbi:hypothetical protein ALI144C_33885 [Actinosynnema sp. ALI-1.44]|uniref:hypothetical protein n=1 Tax=Actinosynnema sp. ALI-1.44 TaxID=1933779 RepID=UPI00097C8904|nr:hypothetical protein [Actinosynnema sp. ALI-1.44]ONI77086.1 hypothetical protein ALI144C_33885 [Actinosynnema sp. ALI-1.44]